MSETIYYPGRWVRVPSIHVNWLVKLPSGYGSRGWFEMHGYITSVSQEWSNGGIAWQTVKVRDWFNGDEFVVDPAVTSIELLDTQPKPKRAQP